MPHVQTWPEALHTAAIDVAEAVSRSASGNTMNGLLPPSSSDTRLTRSAAAAWIALPVATEPVNEIASTAGWSTRAAPTTSPGALHDVEHPGRDARLEGDLGHQHGRHRCLLGGLEHDRVARRQRRGDQREHGRRPFHGMIMPDDADRLAHRVHANSARDGGISPCSFDGHPAK